ncbi:hypothetical protein CFC21_077311 [Triticum aestivum]|uniref:Bifunctional inhibitor/plant lipid transfer protein/seed storage helical domain-containing protein n=1 Tax=Triticum aestivum TaxID=4565 RepID=A0A9R1KZI7_WHEAT|nr:hypothetical protein CFC21_077311 [Triticum aestivum]
MESKRSPRAPAVVVVVVLLLFVLMPDEADAQVFCRSQFNLANEACSLRTYPGANPAVPPRRPLLLNASSSASGYELQAAGDEHSASGGHGGEHGSSHGSEHGGSHVRRRHGHQHHVGGADPYDTACCRRLMGIDNACICQAMSFLPQFMSRVKHSIKLTPVPGCDISFECAGVY